jgi:hypothetical protein
VLHFNFVDISDMSQVVSANDAKYAQAIHRPSFIGACACGVMDG